jgi:hypothetical protein
VVFKESPVTLVLVAALKLLLVRLLSLDEVKANDEVDIGEVVP